MGGSAGKAFGVIPPKGSNITSLRGNTYKWNDYDVLLTFHPSYVARNRHEEGKFDDDIKMIPGLMGISSRNTKKEEVQTLGSGVHYYKIPDKFYTSEYKLVDVQFLNKTNEILYIFRDKDNKKIYNRENDDYICYQCKDEKEA